MPFSFFLARAKCGKSGSGSEALGMTAGRPPVERAFYGPQFAWVLIRVGYLVLHNLKVTFGYPSYLPTNCAMEDYKMGNPTLRSVICLMTILPLPYFLPSCRVLPAAFVYGVVKGERRNLLSIVSLMGCYTVSGATPPQ